MEQPNLKPVVRKLTHCDLPAYQPGVRVHTPFGPITHWARDLALVSRADAKQVAEELVRESLEVGYVTAGICA